MSEPDMSETVLVRYGLIPEVARFRMDGNGPYQRGERVVVQSHRGMEVGDVLETVAGSNPTSDESTDESELQPHVLRRTDEDDEDRQQRQQAECAGEFDEWAMRIAQWGLELELIDLEWLLDRSKLVLYVLNDRGSDCTKLALYAAAEGIGPVEVQPVNAEGLVRLETAGGGGCGTGGGCGSCGSG